MNLATEVALLRILLVGDPIALRNKEARQISLQSIADQLMKVRPLYRPKVVLSAQLTGCPSTVDMLDILWSGTGHNGFQGEAEGFKARKCCICGCRQGTEGGKSAVSQ